MLIYVLAMICYTCAGFCLFHELKDINHAKKSKVLGLLSLSALLHGIVLLPNIITLYGLNFNLFNTLSLVSLIFVLCFTLFASYRPIISLGTLATPTAILGLNLGFFGKAPYQPLSEMSILLQIHIMLSFVAYCILLMATVQSIILRLQIRELKHQTTERYWVSRLPSLQSMESLLFDMILLGFVILSFAIGLGIVITHDIIAQHVAHKLVFSTLSWIVFGILIFGHYKKGWRGVRAANFTLYGFVLLALGFIGSKFVLEMILS